MEMEGVSCDFFEMFLNEFSAHRPNDLKIMIMDNAGFHSLNNIKLPKNIIPIRIPPYSPELNPCEQVWQHMKRKFKHQVFKNIEELKDWLYDIVGTMSAEVIKSITSNHHYLDAFNQTF